MEEEFSLYELPYDPKRVVICFDERPCQLIGQVVTPIPMKPGKVFCQDYHYRRNGTCVAMLTCQPPADRRFASIRQQKTKMDHAPFMEELARPHPEAEKIILVQDNLNTHNPCSFYETFSSEKAFDLTQCLEMRYTPKKAGWLNVAEIELFALSRQCLDRRLGDLATFAGEVEA